MGHRMLPIAFFPDRLPLPWQPIWDKIGYNSAWVRDFREIFGPIGGFWDGPSNAVNYIFPRPTPVAIPTKFGTK